MAASKKPTEFKMPKTLAACADKLYETREKRLELSRKVAELEEIEKRIKEHLIAQLPEQDASGVAGKTCRISLVHKQVPYAKDWNDIYKHIKKTGHFDLLGRRLNSKAVEERWENGEDVPGVETYTTTTVSINKI